MKLNRKWLMVIALVMSLTMATAGTLAYLTDRDSEANVFTMGNVEIDLNEEFNQGAELIPGQNIEKKPTITNTGKTDAWVWMIWSIPTALDNAVQGTETGSNENTIHWNPTGATAEGYVNATRVQKAFADGVLTADMFPAGTTNYVDYITANNMTWNVFNSIDTGKNMFQQNVDGVPYNHYVLLYNKALEPGETTLPSVYNVFLDAHVDIDPDGNMYRVEKGVATDLKWNIKDNGNPVIYVSAYAMQKDGFTTVKEAYNAYNVQWTTDGGVNNGLEFAEIPTIFSWEGVNYVTSGETGEAYANGGDTIYRGIFSDGMTTASKIIIHEGIVRLNNRALCKAPTITSVSLPSTLTYIDESVFQQSNISEIEIPENVTYIGKAAFTECNGLEKIVIKAKEVTFANYVGRGCPALKEVYIYSDSVKFESGSMYFTNAQSGDASGITFYVNSKDVADALYNASTSSQHNGLLIKSIDGNTTYYNPLK